MLPQLSLAIQASLRQHREGCWDCQECRAEPTPGFPLKHECSTQLIDFCILYYTLGVVVNAFNSVTLEANAGWNS